MKPENFHRLTGKDVLRYRRKRTFDLVTFLAYATAAGLMVSILLITVRTL